MSKGIFIANCILWVFISLCFWLLLGLGVIALNPNFSALIGVISSVGAGATTVFGFHLLGLKRTEKSQ